jgi:Raf kinase inhibitor-like YbhB/YbcL family protein
MTLNISSPAFSNGGEIPTKYTADGGGISPPLQISGIPGNAKSLALIVDDPDAPDPKAPKRTFVHWVVYNLPADTTRLAEGLDLKQLPAGSEVGQNDWQQEGYGPPDPPVGRHRYVHKLYALDTVLPHVEHATKRDLLYAMQGHVLDQAELVGTYEKTPATKRS